MVEKLGFLICRSQDFLVPNISSRKYELHSRHRTANSVYTLVLMAFHQFCGLWVAGCIVITLLGYHGCGDDYMTRHHHPCGVLRYPFWGENGMACTPCPAFPCLDPLPLLPPYPHLYLMHAFTYLTLPAACPT